MSGPLRVVGLDLSLTSSGLSDGNPAATHAYRTDDSEPIEARLSAVTDHCLKYVRGFPLPKVPAAFRTADLVVIEGASFGSKGNAVDQLAGLRLMVRCALWRIGVPFAIVAPSTLKAYTTGNGRASKVQMVLGVLDRHGVDFSSFRITTEGRYDMADAFALAAMGYARLGQPLPTTGPPPRQDSMLAVRWPDGLGAS